MIKINALKIRQQFGSVLKQLKKKQEPIVIEKGRIPVAVLIDMETFQKRFIDYREKEKRDRILQLAQETAQPVKEDSLRVLRELRYGSDY